MLSKTPSGGCVELNGAAIHYRERGDALKPSRRSRGAGMSLFTETVDLATDDGGTMRAYVARPAGQGLPGRGRRRGDLVLVGEHDQVISPEQRRQIADALEAAHVRHDVVEYARVGHGFLNDRRDTFDAAAADDAWARIRALFADELVAHQR
jgi:acetyl esterase/lipase